MPPGGAPPSPGGPPPMPSWAHPQLQQQSPWAPAGQPGTWYGGWQAPRKTNALAIAALVTGIVGLFPVAIGLGIAALVQIRRRGDVGTGLAVGGLVASGIWMLIGALIAVAVMSGSLLYSREGDLSDIASREVGTCVNDDPDQVADCASRHGLEIYAVTELPPYAWPGEEEIDTEADDFCYAVFEGYVGASYEDSEYEYGFYAPSESEWDKGLHTAVCVVIPAGRYLTGSVKGSGN